MAVASGWAGQVLARPHFLRPNMHVRTLNTRAYLKSYVYYELVSQALSENNIALGFSVILIHLMAILYCDKAHGRAVCGTCVQLCLYWMCTFWSHHLEIACYSPADMDYHTTCLTVQELFQLKLTS